MKKRPLLTAALYIGYILLFAAFFKFLLPVEMHYNAVYRDQAKGFATWLIINIITYLLFGVLLGLPRIVCVMQGKGHLKFNKSGLIFSIPALLVPLYAYLEILGVVRTNILYHTFASNNNINLLIILFGFSLTLLIKKDESRRR